MIGKNECKSKNTEPPGANVFVTAASIIFPCDGGRGKAVAAAEPVKQTEWDHSRVAPGPDGTPPNALIRGNPLLIGRGWS